MASSLQYRLWAIPGLLLLSAKLALSYQQQYCSSLNTASSGGFTQQFMTTGLCHDRCLSTSAFAVVKGDTCWCSNYAPGSSVDAGQCNQVCPGYGPEQCGNSDSGLYGYVALNLAPSGTQGASSSSSSTETSASASATPSVVTINQTFFRTLTPTLSSLASSSTASTSSVQATATNDNDITTKASTTSTSSAGSTTTSSSDTASPITTDATTATTNGPRTTLIPTSVTTLTTVTQGGEVRTITTTAATLAMATQNPEAAPEPSGLSKPANAAGLGVGLGVAFLIALGIIAFFLLKRRARKLDEKEAAAAAAATGRHGSGSSRPVSSTMSQIFGISKRNSTLPKLQTNGSGDSGTTQFGGSSSPTTTNKRRSNPMIVDQRLDPGTLWLNDNGSKASLGSLRDDRDYSRRVLKLANPDEPES